MLSFSIIASIVMLVINTFTFVCFLSRLEFLKKYKWIVAVLLLIITVLEAVYFNSLRRSLDSAAAIQILASLVGVSFLLFVSSLFYLVFRIPLEVIKFDETRRKALKNILDITIFIAAISWIAKAFVGGFSKPITRSVEVNIKNLKKPLSIAQMTDVHIGKVLGYNFMRECVDITNALNADIIVITGDLVDLPVEQARKSLEPLKDLKAKYGVFYVSGNHEYFHGVRLINNHLRTLGITVLENDSVEINGLINIAGINDLAGKRFGVMPPDVNAALKNTNKNLPTILLSHQPKVVNSLRGDEKIDLILSGHTHGGQIFPFGLLVLLEQPYLYGLYQHNEKTQIFVSSGTGYWGPPLRFLAPSEIVKLELKGV
ncbi:MAG: metallophosphoesterase [Campylobacteraceae bacterium]